MGERKLHRKTITQRRTCGLPARHSQLLYFWWRGRTRANLSSNLVYLLLDQGAATFLLPNVSHWLYYCFRNVKGWVKVTTYQIYLRRCNLACDPVGLCSLFCNRWCMPGWLNLKPFVVPWMTGQDRQLFWLWVSEICSWRWSNAWIPG